MWRHLFDDILGSRAKVRILRCLHAAETPVTGREIARRTGLSHTGVMAALSDLIRFRVVWPLDDRSGTRYRLNRAHEVVRSGLDALFVTERSFEDRLGSTIIAAVPEAISVVLFGSVARGEETAVSDLDLLVVVPDGVDTFDVVDRILDTDPFERWGRLASPIVWEAWMLQRYWEDGLPLLTAIINEGKLIEGAPLITLVRGARRAG